MAIISDYIVLLQDYGVGESTILRQRRRFLGAKITGLGARRERVGSSEGEGRGLGALGQGARRERVRSSEL